MDILSALVDALDPKDYPWLKRFGEVSPLLKKAQEVRNKYVHARWGMGDLSEPLLLRATARGELKLRMEKVTASEIEAAAVDVGRAAIALWKFMVNRM